MAEISFEQLLETALQHHQAGRLAEAERIYRRILSDNPNNHGVLNLLGAIAQETGHPDTAIKLIGRAIAISPTVAGYHNNLGNALCRRGEFGEAVTAYRRAVYIDPGFPLAHYNLGNALLESDSFSELEEAIAASREAIKLRPEYAEAYNNLGIGLHRRGHYDKSIEACRKALSLKPGYADAYNNLGNALKDKGELDAAAIAYRQAIQLKPDFAAPHMNLAVILLLTGEMGKGWAEYEWRLREPGNAKTFPSVTPRWAGQEISGKTLLLCDEQGIGETIQFVRYAPLIAERGCRVIVECCPELVSVLRSNPDLGQIFAWGQTPPPHDLHLPIPSLPLVFGTDLRTIPARIPYLSAKRELIDAWSQKLGPPDGRLRVGLVWAGNPRFKSDRTRSLNLRQLAPFASARGVKFYSLQKGPPGEQAKNPPAGLELLDLGPQLNDFADTAAVMSLMDLMITTDTSVPHLAGALGSPVWVMLQFVPDFRWLLEREDSPWYPTMRLFRQTSLGDWTGVISRVIGELARFGKSGASR